MTTETIQNDPPPVDPAVVANVDPAAPPPAPVADPPAQVEPPAPVTADPPAPAVDPNQHGNKGKKPWFLDRISEETHARQEAQRERDEYKALVDRLQKGSADPAKTATLPAASTDTDVETRAQQIADERIARSQISTVIAAGVKDFPDDWDHRAETLAAVGAATPAFVMDVVAVDPQNAHKILHALSEDPDRAARIAKMDVRGRTAELVRMSMAASAPAPKTDPEPAKPAPKAVSKAPPPPPAIEPGAAQQVEWWSDKASEEQFSKGWEAKQRERANRGRR